MSCGPDPHLCVRISFERTDDDRQALAGQRTSTTAKYTSIGYCTAYRFYAPPQHIRLRISQFLMYPPYQKRGYGRVLLNAIYQHCYSRAEIVEVPVEDPSPQFQRLRDMVDLLNIYHDQSFTADMCNSLPLDVLQAIQRKRKLWKGQIRRCFEIHRLRYTNSSDDKEFTDYRLWIKKRIFKEVSAVISVGQISARRPNVQLACVTYH
jgi:histone acetyltransferase 1